jgi:predicted small secreted protein
MRRRLTLIAALALVVALLSGCVTVKPKAGGGYDFGFTLFPPAQSQSVSSSVIVDTSTAKPIGAKNTPVAAVGKSQVTGPWTITVEGFTVVSSAAQLKPGSGKKFVLVDFSVQNSGSSNSLTVRPSDAALSTGGQTLAPFKVDPSLAFNAEQMISVNPATGGYTQFIFEVPAGFSSGTFTYRPTTPPASAVSWHLR